MTALGPDRVVVGQEIGQQVSREYWQCLTSDGRLVLLYHDLAVAESSDAESALHGTWFLQGWWD